jgi:hypothetical protein
MICYFRPSFFHNQNNYSFINSQFLARYELNFGRNEFDLHQEKNYIVLLFV